MFADRVDAGRQLATELAGSPAAGKGWLEGAVVLGIPRGGVVVAAEVARALALPLDIVAAAKVGAPGNAEYAVGAVAADGEVVANPGAGYRAEQVRELAEPALSKVRHTLADLRAGRAPLDITGRTAIVVDDGIATGLTARAAVRFLRRAGAARVILAVPVAAPGVAQAFAADVDAFVAVETPAFFSAVGQFYGRFGQTEDDEVVRLLEGARG